VHSLDVKVREWGDIIVDSTITYKRQVVIQIIHVLLCHDDKAIWNIDVVNINVQF
jgi:hypothetical protein